MMRIIPAIDVIDGACVRLARGDYQQKKIYHADPLGVAKAFEDYGLQYLHLVDLDGAKSDRIVNYKVLERIATQTRLKIDFGGGIKTAAAVRMAFECGASQVIAGSIAVTDGPLCAAWLEEYGAGKIVLGADVLNGKVMTHGWLQQSGIDLMQLLDTYAKLGIRYVACTDISKDGLLQGCATELYKSVMERFPGIKLVASGGISSLSDLDVLRSAGLDGAIVGKAIYENKISLKELQRYVG